jgi:prevent-host-death family protein
MRAINYSEVRNNLASVLDQVIDDIGPTIITRRGDNDGSRAVVVLPLDSYKVYRDPYVQGSLQRHLRSDASV